LAVLTTAACTSSNGQGQGQAAAGASTTAGAPVSFVPITADTTTPPPLKFPDTDLTVRFTGYDDTLKMVTFVRVTWIPGGEDDGHYAANTSDPAPHRLPLASNVTITSWSSDCAGSTAGAGSYHCTAEQLVTGLEGGGGALSVADLHVDGTDHVSTVHEIFTP
jgi:hypothetical protein